MGVVTYLLRADLRARWRSLAMLMLLVAIVVAAVLTAAAGAMRTRSSFDRYLANVRPMDALVTFDEDPIDPAVAERVDGVAAAVSYRWFSVFPAGGPDGSYFIPLFVPGDARVPDTYQRYPLMAGRLPDPAAPLEIAVGERTARRLDVEVGDSLPAVTYTPAQQAADDFGEPQGPPLAFDVVGIVRNPGDVTARENDVDIDLLTPAFATTYGDDIGLFGGGLLLALEPGASVDQVAQDITSLGNLTFEPLFGAKVFANQADPTLAAMANGLRAVAIIVAFAGGVVVVQALARTAVERRREHEGIRALGATRSVLLVQLALPSALTAGTGIVLGGALSIALSPTVLWGLARRAEPDPGVQVDAPVLVLGMVGAALVIALAIAVVARLTLRRDRRPNDGRRSSALASRAAELGAGVPAVTGLRLALERGRGDRTTPVAAAAVAAAVGGIGVMATVVFAGSLHHAVTTPSVYGWAFDGVLVGRENGDDLADAAKLTLGSALSSDPSFEAVAEIVNDVEVTVDGAPNRSWVLNDLSGHSSFVIARGREPVGSNEVAVGGETLDQLGLDLGDTVEVGAGGPTATLEVVGVAVLPVTDDGGSSATGVAMRGEAAAALGFSGSCQDAECSRFLALSTGSRVDLEDAAAPYLSDEVSLVTPSPPATVERLRAVDGLPRVLAMVLGAIAVLAVTHAAAVTVRRRRRDLAMLRVLGLSGRQLRRVVTIQVAVLALGGATLGVVLGVAVGRLLWGAVAESVPLPTVVAFPVTAVVLVPLGITALAQLGASLSRRAAGRVRPAIALRAE